MMIDKLNFAKGNRARTLFVIFNYLLMVLIIVLMLIPLLKVLSDSLDNTAFYGISLIPKKPSLAAYQRIISSASLYRPFMISVYVTIVGTFIAMFFTTTGAYVMAQKNLPGRGIFIWMIMAAMLFQAGMIPAYMNIKRLGIMNTLWAVILPMALRNYNLILMRNFFMEIPDSVTEAAEIDGASPFQTFCRIVLPMSKPALATIGLFCIVEYWNDFFHYVIYINNSDLYNFQVKLREMVLQDDFGNSSIIVYGRSLQNATIITAMIPVLILYPFLQKYFVKGINLGAIKG